MPDTGSGQSSRWFLSCADEHCGRHDSCARFQRRLRREECTFDQWLAEKQKIGRLVSSPRDGQGRCGMFIKKKIGERGINENPKREEENRDD